MLTSDIYSEHSDESLIHQWIDTRNNAVFKALYVRHRLMVYRISMGYLGNEKDAEDITQDIFIKTLLHKADQFTGASFKAWLSSIVRNACIDLIRSRKASKIDPSIEVDNNEQLEKHGVPNSNTSPEDLLADSQKMLRRKKSIWEALEQLPVKQKEVVILKYFSDLSAKEISEVLQCGENNVNVNLHHALKKLASFESLTKDKIHE